MSDEQPIGDRHTVDHRPSMTRSCFKIVATALAKFFVAIVIIFLLTDFDPASRLQDLSELEISAEREFFGLYDTAFKRFAVWTIKALRGDFGNSMVTHEPISGWIMGSSIATAQLVVTTLCVMVVLSAILCILYRQSKGNAGNVLSVLAIFPAAIPVVIGAYFMAVGMVEVGLYEENYEVSFASPTFWFSVGLLAVLCFERLSLISLCRVGANSSGRQVTLTLVTDVLVIFPVWLVAGVVVIETFTASQGLGVNMYWSIIDQDWSLTRAVAAILAAFVIAFSALGRLLACFAVAPIGTESGSRPKDLDRENSSRLARSLKWAGGTLLVAWAVFAISADLLAPYDPARQDYSNLVASPSTEHLLGTDRYGRDVLSRQLYSAQRIVGVTFSAMLLGWILASLFLFARNRSGKIISLIMSSAGSIPPLIILMICAAKWFEFGRNWYELLAAIALAAGITPGLYRAMASRSQYLPAGNSTVRTETLPWRRFFDLRGSVPRTAAASCCRSGALIVGAVFTVDFLGIGTPQPAASWGEMFLDGRDYTEIAPWIILSPAAAVFFLCLGFQSIAAGLSLNAQDTAQ